ncbi:MAG TPA: hypothetical protein VJM46_02150 [Candidatus Saccharimonadales bacterium]|nr:hypothetical protein [Candidatus Saccharimonadales bacterium]
MLEGSEAAAKFIDTLIDAKLNGAEIDQDVRATLHRDLRTRLEDRIIHDVLAQLSEQEQLEMEHLIDSDQVAEVEAYLTKKGVDINRVLAGAMTEFQAAYLGA